MKKPKKWIIAPEAKIQPQLLTDARRHFRRRGLKQATLDVLESESFLAEYLGNRFASVRRLLKKNGLPPSNTKAVLHALTRMVMEPVLILDESHRRLWLDLLPEGEQMKTHWRECFAIGRVRRKTFVEVNWEPRHVQGLSPTLSEFQAKLFLERNEIPIGTAMQTAGAQAIARLLKEEAERCKP
jgi:hypothetical protein